ncbi:hypothetical protein KCP74_01135 [Salmonella enterica subsp. enterica]|nr:hypothetical protein KCP74_01135 [Salmonella enterica subsp. enterica]
MPRISFMSDSNSERQVLPCTAVKVGAGDCPDEHKEDAFHRAMRQNSRPKPLTNAIFYCSWKGYSQHTASVESPSLRNECCNLNGAYLHKSIDKEG